MKIALLHPSAAGSAAPFASMDPECDPSRYAPEHQWTHIHLEKKTAAAQLIDAARAPFDLFFNLCDGAWDEDRAGIEVVRTLERLGVAFTGAGSLFYDPSRTAMKMAAHSVGINVPPFIVATGEGGVRRAIETLRYPMIVKHPNSYSSIGMTRACRVTNADELAREATTMIGRYGAALIEEFVEGRELTVLVAEPREEGDPPLVCTPVEFVFPQGESFKHFDLKWKSYEDMKTTVVDDPVLDAMAREAAALVFDAIGGSGFGRCDFRLDERGELQFLEINPNCGIFYPEGQFGSADFILANDPVGHRGFVAHLIASGLRRRERARRAWTCEFSRDRGFELVAATPIAEGAIAVRYEEHGQKLVSRGYVESKWRGRRREWFDRYAWPVSEDVFAVWSDDPEDWRPINHSCDPNTWLRGLNLVARRPIAAGETLTVDYATFCGFDMMPFDCTCGTDACRRVIRGEDMTNPALRARYEGHLSDFVARQARAR
jgi:D-alanine-D-alanine ligase-like ATP-grasp enzyme